MPDPIQASTASTTKHYEIDFVYTNNMQQFSTQADLTDTECASVETALERHEASGAIYDAQIYVSYAVHQDFAQVSAELGDALSDPTLGTEAECTATAN